MATADPSPVIPPVVRHFMACRRVETSDAGVALWDPIHAIAARNQTPNRERKLWLCALLASGRGRHEFAVELARYDPSRGSERSVIRSENYSVDLGQDPLAVHYLPIEFKLLDFRHPGPYSFYLLCGGTRIAEEQVAVR